MLERPFGRSTDVPLYEYRCPSCGTFERIQKFVDPPLEACPTCGKTVEKLPSAPAIQFKGTGWYVTDYAKKSGEGKPKDTDPSKDSGSSSASSDSKSASSSDGKGSSDAKPSSETRGSSDGKGSSEKKRFSGTKSSPGSGSGESQ
jgi:putative FmdB family regulatory protein